MALKLSFEIPLGFILKSNTIKTNYYTAEKIMKSKRKRRFSYAKKDGGYIYFEKHYYVCPKCGNRIPAYREYFDKSYRTYQFPSKNEIDDFCSNQTSSAEGSRPQTLSINRLFGDTERLQCQHCFYNSRILPFTRNFFISQNGSVLQLACELIDKKELFELSWVTEFQRQPTSLSIREIVQFDFSTGFVNAFLYDGNNPIFSRTILNPNIFTIEDPCSLALKNINIRRAIRKAYETITSYKCPFGDDDISLSSLFKLTRFVGYDRSFYDRNPFIHDSSFDIEYIESGFEEISNKLQNFSNISKLYDESLLPKDKNVKKMFFQKPQLLFYYKELEAIWKIINEPNQFCKLLNYDHIFQFASYIRETENVIEYYYMVKETKGVAWLCKKLGKCFLHYSTDYVCQSLSYCVASDYEKQKIKECYKNPHQKWSFFSLPMQPGKHFLPDCCIDEYRFTRLRSTVALNPANKALFDKYNYCLIWYSPRENPAFSVQKRGEYIAIIELDDNEFKIMKPFEEREYISPESELGKAIEKWRLRKQ